MCTHPNETDREGEQRQPQAPTISPETKIPEAQNRTDAADYEAAAPRQTPRWADQRWQTIFMGLILFVTCIYAGVSYFQWQTMKDSLRISERAYIVVSDIQPNFETGKIRVVLENNGHVPADKLDIAVQIERHTQPPQGNGLGETLEWNRHYLLPDYNQMPPGGVKTVIDVPLQGYDQVDALLIHSGQQTLYVICFLEYADGFGNMQKVNFPFKYIPPPSEGWASIPLWKGEDLKKRDEERRKAESEKASPN